jgi:4-carboxymuconolactone decarboxylase
MPRIKIRERKEMTEEQKRIYDATAAGKRGGVPTPLAVWLESPVLAERAQKLGEFARYETSLSARLSELAILVVARYWASQFEWSVHKEEALKAGVDLTAIEDIANRRQPSFQSEQERAVFEFSVALNETHFVPEALYRRAVEAIGERGVVELVGILGYYTLISMTLNTFEIEPPVGRPAQLKP